ncbi:PREDICTED: tetranectin-like [Poecilia mexicana]|uniref:C-type lectin domain-containing protein n=1 Tax=Poecilia mexicana TaxID=48701 RepID=A0A3B3WN57_9TELE|nr:PREDICTED: tetranectin-like [Poecilia mexicana]
MSTSEPHSTGSRMEFRGVSVLLGVLLLIHCSLQQTATRKKPVKKDTLQDAAVVELQKRIDEIIQDLNLLKEKQALQTVCLRGEKIHKKCFLADPLKKRYHTASEDCNSLGGVLATPSSSEENDRLRDYIRQSVGPDGQVWLGVNDMTIEGQWMDQTGSSITYKNWDASNFRSPQPDGGKSQNCGAMSLTGGKWLDENCREEKPSVCEFNIV